MTKYYILPMTGAVEPEPLIGPFRSYEGMLKRAVEVYARQKDEDTMFYVVMQGDRKPQVGAFEMFELDKLSNRYVYV